MAVRRRALALAAALVLASGGAQGEGGWGAVRTPTGGPPLAIGGTSAGCIAGAHALPVEDASYRVLRPARRRHFGHPTLVAYVESLARALRAAGLGPLAVGDLAQPRGGPMPGGHASHQTGLDVDLYFDPAPKPSRASNDLAARTLVRPDNLSVDPDRWRPEHVRRLTLAAAPVEVDRVFVHPAIKRALCLAPESDRAWLHKIRPWYGHDAHFHVRLRCPGGSPGCDGGPELPPGDGCDETLAWWFEEEEGRLHAYREVDPRPEQPSGPPRERTPLPAACEDVLHAS